MPPAAQRCVVVARREPMGCWGLFVTAVLNCENKNLGVFATFLRLGTLFRLCKTETCYRAVAHLRFCSVDLRLDALKQSPIAKKLQPRPVFVSGPLGWARGGAGLAHVALVTHGKESNAMGGAGLALSVEWRVSHFLPLLPLKRANGAVFLKIDGLMLRFMAKM